MAVVDGPKFHWFPSNYIQMSSIIIYCNPFRKKDHRGQVGATDEKHLGYSKHHGQRS